jgi:hypothetical protein
MMTFSGESGTCNATDCPPRYLEADKMKAMLAKKEKPA